MGNAIVALASGRQPLHCAWNDDDVLEKLNNVSENSNRSILKLSEVQHMVCTRIGSHEV